MSSLEARRTDDHLTAYRIRYRHNGRNMAVTFPTEDTARTWQRLLDNEGHDVAYEAVLPPPPPDLGAFEDRILSHSIGPERFDPRGHYVYCLRGVDPHRPVYVGASSNIWIRIGSHLQERGRYFNRVSAMHVTDANTMWLLEGHLINHYRPYLNVAPGRAA